MKQRLKVGQHTATLKWWASYHSPIFGEATQWGASRKEALLNLRKYVVEVWKESFPDNELLSLIHPGGEFKAEDIPF